ncbi:MAG: VCBS repeat-containing protein [Bacteroidales bacterium]|nr:VCBS repeat-containing protein [Bacteroidales bacterium]
MAAVLMALIFTPSSAQVFEEIKDDFWGTGDIANGAATFTDLNNDGLLDLVTRGIDTYHLVHFIQEAPNSESFILSDSSFISYPQNSLYGVQTFYDIDGDGLLDMLVGKNSSGILHYEQSAQNSFDFTLISETFNGIAESSAKPAITDLDGDGLLDLVVGLNQSLLHYEQVSANSYSFQLVPGTFSGLSIPNNSNTFFTDLDNDGLIDMLVGGTVASEGVIRHFEQTAVNALTFNYFSATFNSLIKDPNTMPTVCDIDNDGLLDLIAGSYSSIQYHYEQSSPASTAFDLRSRFFIGMDVYSSSKPAITDIDHDGLLDMLIGNGGGRLFLFEQTSTGSTEFTYVDSPFSSILNDENATPVFDDFESDGLLDLVIGRQDGRLSHYTQDSYGSYSFTLVTHYFNNIDVGGNSSPTFGDIDNDGLLDLLVGKFGVSISRYEQSAPNSTGFVLITNNFDLADLGPLNTPHINDIDQDNLLDLFVGDLEHIIHYRQSGTGSEDFNLITDTYADIYISGVAPFVVDIDSDNDMDLVVGENNGGIHLFLNRTLNCLQAISPPDLSIETSLDSHLAWTSDNNADGYLLYFGTDNPPGNLLSGFDAGPDTTYTPLSPLEYNTAYYWQVRPYNAHDTLESCATWSFTTETRYELPLYQTFSGCTIPAGWTQDSLSGLPPVWTCENSSAAGGSPYEMVAHSNNGTGISRLITPKINTSGISELIVEFSHYFSSSSGFGLLAYIESSSDGVNWTSGSWYAMSGIGNIGPETVSVPVTQNLGNETWISFTISGNHDLFNNWNIDDIWLYDGSGYLPCTLPVSPWNGASDVSLKTNLEWEVSPGATGYYLYLGTDNPPTNIENGLDMGNSTLYDPQTDLSNLTQYFWQVVPYNTNGSASGCETWSFTTIYLNPPQYLQASTQNFLDVQLDWLAPEFAPVNKILCVDRDGSKDLGFNDDWQYLKPAFDNLNVEYYYYEVTDLTQDGPDLAFMQLFDLIFWFTGEAWENHQTMSQNDLDNLVAYLENGGNLFLSSQDYLYDWWQYWNNFYPGYFPYDYLGISAVSQEYWNINSPATAMINGVTGSFAEGAVFDVRDIYSAKDGLFIDKITALQQNLLEVTSPTPTGNAACQFIGANFKTAFSTIPIAAITNQADIENLLSSAFNWFFTGKSKTLQSYNVYRDNQFIDNVSNSEYTDSGIDPGSHDYFVTALYDEGESAPSDTVSVYIDPSAVYPLNLEASILNYFDLQLDWDYLSNPLYLDDFESYSTGDFIAVQNPAWWTTWSNQPGGGEDAPVTDALANSGSQSIVIEGTTDVVLKFGNKTAGRYQFSFNMYIPTGFSGYFNLQKYETPGTEFGEQIFFFEDGTARFDLEYGGVLNFTYPKDAWFEVVQIIDLDSDLTRLYVDGYLIREWPFSYSQNTTGGSLQLGGFDFWAGAENGETPKYYIDDIQFREILSAKNNSETLLGFNVYKDGVNMGLSPSSQYIETGLPAGNYTYYATAVFNNGESDPSYSVKVEIKGPPQADFEAGITHISDGGTIHFTDLSTGTVNAWEWDLDGDGTADSWDQNPSFTYNSAGTYSVTLTAGDGVNSSTLTKTDYITVQSEPLLINVPGDIWTIQGAVDGAYDGDTVLVQPGTYYENVMCQNKDIVIASLILFTGDTSYISQTIVDGGENGSVFQLSYQGETAELSGFTFTNGSYILGGGLQLSSSSAKVTHIKITGNQTTGNGGGIHISGAHPVLSNIKVTNNAAQAGGGLYISSGNPIIKESAITGNTASAGAGLYLFSTSALIENNEITNNYAYTNGGGIYIHNCSPQIIGNLISGNWSDNQTSGAGGIRCNSNASPTMISNTIVNNTGAYGGGLRVMGNSDPVLINNIIWGNTATVSGNQVRLDDDTSDPAFMFCDVQDGVAGFGKEPGTLFTGAYYSCIEDDPLFADLPNEDFQLTAISPCINTGNPDTTSLNLPEFDLAGNLRIQDGIIDMGCYEYTPSGNQLSVDVKVFLEGPFNGSEMSSTLNAGGQLPFTQPYNTAPWNYTGTENVAAIPNSNVVDWVLVELRDAATASQATGQQTVAVKAAFLLRDGTIVGADGQSVLQFDNVSIQQSLFAVVWHRNSIAIMSSAPLTETGGIHTYDFTTGSGQAYGGVQAHKELAPGIWGMIAADGNSDGQINNSDKNDVWAAQAGTNGYLQGDFSMDGQVNNTDKNEIWKPNTGLGGQVPQ